MGGTYHTTSDYGLFCWMEGNRPHDNPQYMRRVKGIEQSIEAVGYVTNPIIVNEKMEIIDGQTRFGALKNLGLPVDYIVVKGAGIKECIEMNRKQSNWSQADFVYSHAAMGNPHYMAIWKRMEEHPWMDIRAVVFALSGLQNAAGLTKGRIEVRMDLVNLADGALRYADRFQEVTGQMTKNKKLHCKRDMQMALIFCYYDPAVVNKRMFDVVQERWPDMIPGTNMTGTLQSLEKLYNRNLAQKQRIYLETDFAREGVDIIYTGKC